MPGCQDARMSGCQDVRMSGCQDVRMSGCQDARMSGCQDVRIIALSSVFKPTKNKQIHLPTSDQLVPLLLLPPVLE